LLVWIFLRCRNRFCVFVIFSLFIVRVSKVVYFTFGREHIGTREVSSVSSLLHPCLPPHFGENLRFDSLVFVLSPWYDFDPVRRFFWLGGAGFVVFCTYCLGFAQWFFCCGLFFWLFLGALLRGLLCSCRAFFFEPLPWRGNRLVGTWFCVRLLLDPFVIFGVFPGFFGPLGLFQVLALTGAPFFGIGVPFLFGPPSPVKPDLPSSPLVEDAYGFAGLPLSEALLL